MSEARPSNVVRPCIKIHHGDDDDKDDNDNDDYNDDDDDSDTFRSLPILSPPCSPYTCHGKAFLLPLLLWHYLLPFYFGITMTFGGQACVCCTWSWSWILPGRVD